MEQNYEGAARRLARVLELSTRAAHDAVPLDGKRTRLQQPAERLANELSKMIAEDRDPRRRGP